MALDLQPELDRCSRDTTTGAASTRLVVKTAAEVAVESDTSSARSSLVSALMPALMPAARKPTGAVTPGPTLEELPIIRRAWRPPQGRDRRCQAANRAAPPWRTAR